MALRGHKARELFKLYTSSRSQAAATLFSEKHPTCRPLSAYASRFQSPTEEDLKGAVNLREPQGTSWQHLYSPAWLKVPITTCERDKPHCI